MNKVLIIGNGFDLDLGLRTRYSDFVVSDKWPLRYKSVIDSPLAYYLNRNDKSLSWFGLEDLLHDYSSIDTGNIHRTSSNKSLSIEDYIKNDKIFYSELNQSLESYIDGQQHNDININSLAAKLLKAVCENGGFNKIFTFNYTDLNIFVNKLHLKDKIEFQYVHGSCSNGSAIIGVSDSFKLKKGYEYLYKTSSPYYSSSNVRYALQQSKEVVFFGHSLGSQDYHYFEDFFRLQCRPDMTQQDMCKITFFTKDESSRQQLLYQLRYMNNGRINYLFDCNDLQFIKTEDGETEQFNSFIQHLRDTSLPYHIRIL